MADNNNDKKSNLGPDQQRQRTGQPGEVGKPHKPPTKVGNQDQDRNKMPPERDRAANDDLDIDVDDGRSPQRPPMPGAKP